MKNIIIRGTLGGILLFIALFTIDFHKILENIKGCEFVLLMAAAAVSFGGLFWLLWLRKHLLNIISEVSFAIILKSNFTANYINNIIPANVGGLLAEPWGFYSFSRGAIPLSKGLALVILSTIMQNVRRIVLSVGALMLFYRLLPKEYIGVIGLALLVYIAYTVIFVLLVFHDRIPVFSLKPFALIFDKLFKGFIQKRISPEMKSFPDKIRESFRLFLKNKKTYLLLVLLIISDVLLEGFRLWLVLFAFGVSFNFWLILIVPSLIYSVTVLPVSLGGLGVAELSGIIVLQAIGISPEIAFPAVFLDRFLFSYWGLLLGGIFVPFIKLPRKEAFL